MQTGFDLVASLVSPLISPNFTGTPTAPTATVGTNTTQLATTAFVLAQSFSATGAEFLTNKDASNGYAGLTLYKLNLRNVAGTFTSGLTNFATAARTWTMPNQDGTVAMTTDITGGTLAGSFATLQTSGNAGIGVASLGEKLALNGGIRFRGLESAAVTYSGIGSLVGDNVSISTVGLERMRVDTTGAVTIPGSLSITGPATLGYGTGAGGTVTQATSKSTLVTLNKPCGQITMNIEALAAGASVTFELTNNLLQPSSVIAIHSADYTSVGGGTLAYASAYSVRALLVAPAAQSAYITVTNTSAGSRADAVKLNFAILSGAQS